MSAVAAAIIGGAVIAGVASKHASDTAAKSARNANQSLDAKFQQTRTDELPFITGGQSAMGRLGDLAGTSGNTAAEGYGSLTKPFTAEDYLANKDPGYQFQLQQGDQAVQNRNAAGSGSVSGAALKDIASYNQEYAKTGYQSAYDRWTTNMNNTFARLSGIATLGQNAASQTGAQGVAVGQQQSANTTAAGNAAAAAQANMGNLAANAGTDYALYRGVYGGGTGANGGIDFHDSPVMP
jgi:hypothetical protein